MGRRREPLEKLAARSPDGITPGKRRLPAPMEVVPCRVVPDPPPGLSGRGAVEWARIWEAGFWLHRDKDYHWVEMITQAYTDIEIFRRQVEADGLVVSGYNGQMVAHPLIREIRDAERSIQKCLSVLGFSPSDRARLAITEARAQNEILKLQQE